MITTSPVRQAGVLKSKTSGDEQEPGWPGLSMDTLQKEKALFKFETTLSISEIFPITFCYLEQVIHTKVLEVKYSEHQIIYKAVLESKLGAGTNICWLQYRSQGWDLQIGQNMDQGLVKVITSAIDQRRLKLNHS